MEIRIQSWTEFKDLLLSKAGMIQYYTQTNTYVIWFAEGDIYYIHEIGIISPTPDPSDQKDFEDNYKDDANQPVFLGEDVVMTASAIRDTADHYSSVSDNRGFIPKTIIVYNDTDQTITIPVEGDRDEDFDQEMLIGDEFTIPAGDHDYVTLSDYLPFLRIKVSFTSAPTTGDVSGFIMRTRT